MKKGAAGNSYDCRAFYLDTCFQAIGVLCDTSKTDIWLCPRLIIFEFCYCPVLIYTVG